VDGIGLSRHGGGQGERQQAVWRESKEAERGAEEAVHLVQAVSAARPSMEALEGGVRPAETWPEERPRSVYVRRTMESRPGTRRRAVEEGTYSPTVVELVRARPNPKGFHLE